MLALVPLYADVIVSSSSRPPLQFSSSQRKQRATALEVGSRVDVLRSVVINKHHVGRTWTCENRACGRLCGIGTGCGAAVKCKQCKRTLCPDCDWQAHTNVETTSAGFHARTAMFCKADFTGTTSQALAPLQFVRVQGGSPEIGKGDQRDILAYHYELALQELQSVQSMLTRGGEGTLGGQAQVAMSTINDFVHFLQSQLATVKSTTNASSGGSAAATGNNSEQTLDLACACGTPELVSWEDYTPADGLSKHPVLMPMRATCSECGCKQFVPNVSQFSVIKLVDWEGVGDIHTCDWHCSNCTSSLQSQHNGTAWYLAHGVLPSTSSRATTVISTGMLDMFVSMESFHGSFNPTALQSVLKDYFKPHGNELGRAVEGYESGGYPVSKDLLYKWIAKWKALQINFRMAAKQNDSVCTACTSGVTVYSTDACNKAEQHFSNNRDNDTSNRITGNVSLDKDFVDTFQACFDAAKSSRASSAKGSHGCAGRNFKAADPKQSSKGKKTQVLGTFQATCEHGNVCTMSAMHQHENTAAHTLHHLVMLETYGSVFCHSLDISCRYTKTAKWFMAYIQENSEKLPVEIRQRFTGLGDQQRRAIGAQPWRYNTLEMMVYAAYSSLIDGGCHELIPSFDSAGGVEQCISTIFDLALAEEPVGVSQGRWADAESVSRLLEEKYDIKMPPAFVVSAGGPDWAGRWLTHRTDQFHVGMHQKPCRPLTSVLNLAADVDARILPSVRKSVEEMQLELRSRRECASGAGSAAGAGFGVGSGSSSGNDVDDGTRTVKKRLRFDFGGSVGDNGITTPATQQTATMQWQQPTVGKHDGGSSERRWPSSTFARVRSANLVNYIDIQCLCLLAENRFKMDGIVSALVKSHTNAVVLLPAALQSLIEAAVVLPVGICGPAHEIYKECRLHSKPAHILLAGNTMLEESLHHWFSGPSGLIFRVKKRAKEMEAASISLFNGCPAAKDAFKYLKNLTLHDSFQANLEHCSTLSSRPSSAAAVAIGMDGISAALHASLQSTQPSPVKPQKQKKVYSKESLATELAASKTAFMRHGLVGDDADNSEAVKAAAIVVLEQLIGRSALNVHSTWADWMRCIDELKRVKGGGAKGSTAARKAAQKKKKSVSTAAKRAVEQYNQLVSKVNAANLTEIGPLTMSPSVPEMTDAESHKEPPPLRCHVEATKTGHKEEEQLSFLWVKYVALKNHYKFCEDGLAAVSNANIARERMCRLDVDRLNESSADALEIEHLGAVTPKYVR